MGTSEGMKMVVLRTVCSVEELVVVSFLAELSGSEAILKWLSWRQVMIESSKYLSLETVNWATPVMIPKSGKRVFPW